MFCGSRSRNATLTSGGGVPAGGKPTPVMVSVAPRCALMVCGITPVTRGAHSSVFQLNLGRIGFRV